jgi:hypothetical protein
MRIYWMRTKRWRECKCGREIGRAVLTDVRSTDDTPYWSRRLFRRWHIGFHFFTFTFCGVSGRGCIRGQQGRIECLRSSLSASVRKLHVLTVYPGPIRTAHARRYSPDNTRETRRMAPHRLTSASPGAVQQRKRTLIPGAANRMFALLGVFARGLTNILMRRALFDKSQG